MRRSSLAALTVVAISVVAAGCGRNAADANPDAAIKVVATTTQVADFARNVGGDRVSVESLLSATSDPHDFEPKPSDARAVAEADVVLRSGGDLDAWLGDVIKGAGGHAEQVTLIDTVRAISGGHASTAQHAGDDQLDPHWWQDPRNVERATAAIRAAFAKADPAGAATYDAGAKAYTRKVAALDTAIARCFAAIPAARRKLVTNHDAFGYFARRYDVEILGSIIPALSTSAQPSAGDVRQLVADIRAADVTTIFPESAINQRLESAVARDAGAKVGPTLYADALGKPGTEGATYLGALRHDAAAMAAGFGVDCRDLAAAR
jgi:ABC-type Zn uptake system ZnuABC Zn-binding protein ZnuA